MSAPVLELLLCDARTPTGGYAHSGGLEAWIAEQSREMTSDSADVVAFMRARLLTVGRVEAAFAAAACRAGTVEALLELDAEFAARTPPEPLRRAARALGRGLLRTALTWFPDAEPLSAYRARSELTPRPVALGAVARAGALDAMAVARASLYDDAATVAAAAVKLHPLDAAVASGWVLALASEIEALAGDVGAAPCGASDLPSTATPQLDRRAMIHATSERRLFVS